MSEENVELVEQMWKTMMSGDPSTIPPSFLDPEIIFEDEILPDHGSETYRGKDGIQRAWDQALESFEEGAENEIVWARSAGEDQVVTYHHVRARGRGSGIKLEFDYAYLWRLREGKVTYCKSFRDAAGALEAAGLSG